MAEEFVDVVKLLWDSWEESGLLWDKKSGVKFDPAKLHPIRFKGKVYSVEGHLSIPRPPQGHPVIVQAGSSESGKELAARTAEVIFTIQASMQSSQRFYQDVKNRMRKYGRSPDQLLVMPGLNTILGETAAEAQDLEDRLNELNDTDAMIANIYERFGIDLSGYPLDAPLPSFEHAKSVDTADGKGHHQVVLDIAQGQNLTIRQLINRLSGASGHMNFTGTPLQLADLIESWITNHACDGFNLMCSLLPDGLELFVDKVVPELQNRGLFRTAYEGTTLRENLGLEKPANVFADKNKVRT
jgi:FMN-dependent oxidoreductase (nitrilotriacetate monooxygenase family)